MLELVQHLVSWHKCRFMDPDVWERYLRHVLAPELMPGPSELELPAPIHLEQLSIGEMVNKMHSF